MKKPQYEKAFNDLCKWIASEQTTLIPKSTLTNKIHRIKTEHIFPEVNPELFNQERNKYANE